ncbi:hydroxymethylglutaryl-CoA reductase [Pseudomonas akapageensis]|uniref:hydroxymethylglutaryl-CoA reductase n=1 Tax=Pseudomonas akapageensis TaxID=2609961 RepID=UPI001408B17D|nr:hydroxymethylglutaryl-CoA reductase [Pseudomonas akapageensis]
MQSSPDATNDHWVNALIKGDIRLHQLPDDLPCNEAARIRREALQHLTHASLQATGNYTFDPRHAKCENFIGATQIPVGVVGPLLVNGQHICAQEPIYVPMATTEGALIASIARGCSALRAAGGAIVRVEDVGITRAPVFRSSGIVQTQEFLNWINEHYQNIKDECEAQSRYLKLLDITPAVVGTSIYLRFRFSSGDAMGMNMATLACDRVIASLIVPGTGVQCISISGNHCVDKKPAAINFLNGRGKRIFAEVCLSADTLLKTLKTRAEPLCEVQYRKNLLGSIMAGASGFNAHHANMLSAFFIATGQDVAQVAESAMGITCIEAREDGAVYASVLLPDTPLATVGGGTGLSTQREALALLGINPGARAPGVDTLRLAEILGALVLAGELSIMAAQAAHHLAQAHERLGR